MKEWLKHRYKRFFIPAIFLVFGLSGCEAEKGGNHSAHEGHVHNTAEEIYTCPMHPEVRETEPGICPICKMDLVKAGEDGKSSGLQLGDVLQPTDKAVLSSVKMVSPDSMKIYPELEVHGKIEFDPRFAHSVSVNFRGRIEKLYVRYNYQPVKKGEPLLEFFSEELQNAQENYLFLIKKDPDAVDLIKAADDKLRLLGMTYFQIEKLRKSGGAYVPLTTIYAPVSGIIVEKNLTAGTAAEKDAAEGGMENMKKGSTPAQSKLSVREGMYAARGERLFTILSTDRLWGVLEVHGTEAGQIRKGQKMELKPGAGGIIHTKVDFIDPDADVGKNVQVRAYLSNRNRGLFVGDLLSGTIKADSVAGLFLPASSVLDLGERKVVFVYEEGVFKVKAISTGIRSGESIQVLEGVGPEDEVAEKAAYLVDSDSFIKTARK